MAGVKGMRTEGQNTVHLWANSCRLQADANATKRERRNRWRRGRQSSGSGQNGRALVLPGRVNGDQRGRNVDE
jgi:hypothetical protein